MPALDIVGFVGWAKRSVPIMFDDVLRSEISVVLSGGTTRSASFVPPYNT